MIERKKWTTIEIIRNLLTILIHTEFKAFRRIGITNLIAAIYTITTNRQVWAEKSLMGMKKSETMTQLMRKYMWDFRKPFAIRKIWKRT